MKHSYSRPDGILLLLLWNMLFISIGQRGWTQITAKKKVDSLHYLVQHALNEEEKASLYKDLSFAYRLYDPEDGIAYANKGIALAKGNNSTSILADCYLSKGLNLMQTGRSAEALEAFEHSMTMATAVKNKVMMANAKSGISLVYGITGKTKLALQYLLEALNEIDNENAPVSLGNISNLIGNIYQQQAVYPKALEYYLKALKYLTLTKDPISIAEANSNLGNNYNFGMADYVQAMNYYQRALALYEKEQYKKGIATITMNMGTLYYTQGKMDHALQYYLITDSLIGKDSVENIITSDNSLPYLYNNLGAIYTAKNEFDKAGFYLEKAIAIALKCKIEDNIALAMHSMGELYFKKANSITYEQQKTVLLAKAAEYIEDAAKRYLNTGSLQFYPLAQFQLSEIYRAQKRYDRAFAALTEHTRYKDSLFNREKEREFARREVEFEYAQKQDSLKIEQVKKDTAASFRLRQQWLYSGIVLLVLVTLACFYFYRNRAQQARLKAELAWKKAEQEKTAAEFQVGISNAALSSLRSQMNPHFIFNCLNSIKLYAAKNDSQAATRYLSKFSRLMRLVLENSKTEMISLAQEEETLRLYLEMEAMRFKQKLQFHLEIDPGIDKEYTELPPMLIQPYIENAIWHGLMHKEEGGRIDVLFEEVNDTLIVTVRDNGVGRVKAEELKSESTPGHKSFGTHITNERLELLNKKYGIHTFITIHDLYEEGKATGTEVIIQIPVA